MSLEDEVGELGRTLGDELLQPTEIYVRAVVDLWNSGIHPTGLVHITSDGFANLCRLDAQVGFRIDELPRIPSIFELIRRHGDIDDSEMYRVFNMGVGFVAIVDEQDLEPALTSITGSGYGTIRIGTVTDETGVVTIGPAGLRGGLADGESFFETY